MNDELKASLKDQASEVGAAGYRYKTAKAALDKFDANTRKTVKADGVKRTVDEVDALVLLAEGRDALVEAVNNAEAAYEALRTRTQCLLAEVSLVCSETAAMSRIAGQ